MYDQGLKYCPHRNFNYKYIYKISTFMDIFIDLKVL